MGLGRRGERWSLENYRWVAVTSEICKLSALYTPTGGFLSFTKYLIGFRIRIVINSKSIKSMLGVEKFSFSWWRTHLDGLYAGYSVV